MEPAISEAQLKLNQAYWLRNGKGSLCLLLARQCFMASSITIVQELADLKVVEEGHLVLKYHAIEDQEVRWDIVYVKDLPQLILCHHINIAKPYPFLILGGQ